MADESVENPGRSFDRRRADLTRKYLRVSFQKPKMSELFFPEKKEQEFVIPYPESGLTFLLGRNGSGKTTFLDGLRSLFGEGESSRCQVSLICDTRSAWSDLEWSDYCEERRIDYGYSGPGTSDWAVDCPTLLYLMDLRRFSSEPRPLQGRYSGLSGRQFLEKIGYKADEIPSFISNDPGSITPVYEPSLFETEIEWRGPSTMGVCTAPSWLLLDLLSDTTLDMESRAHFPHDFVDPEEWLSDPSKATLLRNAIQEFSEQVELEFASFSDGFYFRYLRERPESGPLSEFQQLVPRGDGTNIDDHRPFPYGVFFDTVGSYGIPYLCSSWRRISPKSPLGVKVLNPHQATLDRLHDVETRIIDRFVRISLTEKDTDSLTIKLQNFKDLDVIAEVLSHLLNGMECGIGEVRVCSPLTADRPTTEKLLESASVTPSTPLRIVFQWRRDANEDWKSLSKSSEGQRQLFWVTLEVISADLDQNDEIILADEIDAHLHPVAARRLFEWSDSVLKRANAVGLFTSHRPTPTSNQSIFAVRNADSTFSLTVEPFESDFNVLSELLGTSDLEVLSLRRLVVVVEGHHDLRVLEQMFRGEGDAKQFVWFVQSEGIRNFGLLWDVLLRLMSVPILFVHDKKNEDLERCVDALKMPGSRSDPWEDSGLAVMLNELKQRKKLSIWERPVGDDELARMLSTLERVVRLGRQSHIWVHGLSKEDIVDYLEEGQFKKVTSWESAHRQAREDRIDGAAFKQRHQINENFEKALQSDSLTWHPDLQELYDQIRRLAGL